MEFKLLRGVRATLVRIDDGGYGVCLHCEKPVSPMYLQAVPWATYCERRQEAVERRELEEKVLDDELDLPDAA